MKDVAMISKELQANYSIVDDELQRLVERRPTLTHGLAPEKINETLKSTDQQFDRLTYEKERFQNEIIQVSAAAVKLFRDPENQQRSKDYEFL